MVYFILFTWLVADFTRFFILFYFSKLVDVVHSSSSGMFKKAVADSTDNLAFDANETSRKGVLSLFPVSRHSPTAPPGEP